MQNMEAKWMLGLHYAFGHGCERNVMESRKWFLRAERQGYQPKELILKRYSLRDKINGSIALGRAIDMYEKKNSLSSNNLSFRERSQRFTEKFLPNDKNEMFKQCIDIIGLAFVQGKSPSISPIICTKEAEILVKGRNMRGSKMARRLLEAKQLTKQIFTHIDDKEYSSALERYMEAYRLESSAMY